MLEVGVGTGAVAIALRRAGLDVVGVDLSPGMLARAVDRLGSRVAVADAQRLPIASGSMAAVYAAWVLHLVADPAAALAEVARVLRPGGVFVAVLSTPIELRTDVDRLLRAMQAVIRGPRGDSVERIRGLAAGAGLELVEATDVDNEPHSTTPAEVIQRIHDQVYSILWDLDEETWATVVEPGIEALRALPEPDRLRLHSDPYPMLVFRSP